MHNLSMPQNLAGRVAIVTGGGWNIGRGVALGLANAGARVVVASRNAANLEESVRLIEAEGGEAFARPTDVTDLPSVEGLIEETLTRWGQIDILAAMAGGGSVKESIETMDPAAFGRIFEVNVTSAFYCIRAVLPTMRAAGRGTIITCSGGGAYYPVPGDTIAPYASAKAAVCRMTDQLTAEYWETDLRFHCIDPGVVWNPDRLADEEAEEQRTGVPHPHRDILHSPAAAGELAVWLASDESRPLRGRCVSVNDDWWRDPEQVEAVHATIHRYRLRRDDL